MKKPLRLVPFKKKNGKIPHMNILQARSVKLSAVGKAIRDIERGANATKRREAAIRASIWVLVTKGHGPHSQANEVNRFLPKAWWFHSDDSLVRITGGREALLERMASGGVIPTGGLGAWSPDLWAGLQLGGAFFRCYPAGGSWRTAQTNSRPALALALKGATSCHMRVKEWYSASFGSCLSLCGLWAAYLGADEPGGVGVFRGILCSARFVKHNGRAWVGVPVRDGVIKVADGLGVPYIIVGKGGVRAILFSPFWGALLSPDMPFELGEWYRGLAAKGAGMCPLLPWVFLRGAWGIKMSGKGDFPSDIVPGLVRRETLWQAGWEVSGMMEAGLRELGMTRVDNRLREAWLRWMEWKGIRGGDFRDGKVPAGLIEPLGSNAPLANLGSHSDVPSE